MSPSQGSPAPMQGLAAAAPQGSQGPEAGGGEDLLQAATSILQDAVSQYGPEIVQVLTELLSEASAPPDAGGPPGMV